MTVLRPRRVRPSQRRKARAERARVRYEWDILGGTLRWGAGLDGLIGYTGGSEPWSLEAWTGLLHPHEALGVDRAMVEALDSEAARWSAEYRMLRLDGSSVRVVDEGRIERDRDGRALRLVGVLHALP